MIDNDSEVIASTISQIEEYLPKLEESIISIKNELPPNLNFTLLNIKSNIKEAYEIFKNKSMSPSTPSEKNINAIPIIDDNSTLIEKHQRYLKKHLNNATQKHFAELDDKMKKIELEFHPYLNSNSFDKESSGQTFKKLENKILNSYKNFNDKCNELSSKISDTHVQKKFFFKNTINNLTKSLNLQLQQNKDEIDDLKIKVNETQKFLDKVNSKNKLRNFITNSKNQTQNLINVSPEIHEKIPEQKQSVDSLNNKWIGARKTLTNELLKIDHSFDLLLASTENVQKSILNSQEKIAEIQIESQEINQSFDSLHDRVIEENENLNQSDAKKGISKFKFEFMNFIESDKAQIESLEDEVNQLYDKITTSS